MKALHGDDPSAPTWEQRPARPGRRPDRPRRGVRHPRRCPVGLRQLVGPQGGLARAGNMAAASMAASLADRRPARPAVAAASAAAFATGIALELPCLGVPALAIGAGPVISRAMAQADHPQDVLAGAALGAGAGLFTLRWWPRRPRRPATAARPPRRVRPPRPGKAWPC